MTQSMTAFARGEHALKAGSLGCEIKSVNHRYLDVSLRAPSPLRHLEPEIIRRVRAKLRRGRVECCLTLAGEDRAALPPIDTEALLVFAKEMRRAEDKLHSVGMDLAPVSVLEAIQWSNAAQVGGGDEALPQDALRLLDQTLDALIETRRQEGQRLQQFILTTAQTLEKTVSTLREHYPQALEAAGKKLTRHLAEVKTRVEPERLAQETVLLVQKFRINADIEEELDRCDSHLQALQAIFKHKQPGGKHLDFLMQELHREVNTMASKSADTETTHGVLEAKTLIEQMREQVQNIE